MVGWNPPLIAPFCPLPPASCLLQCGEKTRAKLPEEVTQSGYGERVTAIVALLNGMYHHSHRMIITAMRDLFGVKICLGTVNRLRKEGSNSVAQAVEEAKSYIQSASEVGADETGFKQGNGDGQNPQQKKAWLWVAVTPLVSYFQLTLSRSGEAAKSLLGENFRGILNSDRYGAYNWLDVNQRQHGTGASKKRVHQNFGTEWCISSTRKRLTGSTEKVISPLAASQRRHSQLEFFSIGGLTSARESKKCTFIRCSI